MAMVMLFEFELNQLRKCEHDEDEDVEACL